MDRVIVTEWMEDLWRLGLGSDVTCALTLTPPVVRELGAAAAEGTRRMMNVGPLCGIGIGGDGLVLGFARLS